MITLGRMFAAALVLTVAVPGAQARPRFGPAGLVLVPLAIVGGVAGAALGSRKARAHRAYQYRYVARRDRAAIRQARAAAAPPQPTAEPVVTPTPAPAPARAVSAGWVGPLFWPHAYDGVFEYAFGLPGDDNQFWARGFGDVLDGMFAPRTRETDGRRPSDAAYQPAPAWTGLCGSEVPTATETTIERIRQAVQLNETQQAVLTELRSALSRATERIETACPSRHASTPPERLHLMIARLSAMRQAVLTVQGPLRTFYELLSEEQKSVLERAGSDGADTRADAAQTAGCAAPVAHWPQQQIERVLQPTKAQRMLLEQLRQTSLGLAQFVASTCPAQLPRTALERLDAIKDRLAVLRYAASNVSPAFEQFYAALSDTQKARFQAMARDRRADSGR